MIKYFCDRCGKDLGKERRIGYIVVNSKDKADGDLQGDNEFENAHFCAACTDAIAKFVRKAPEPMQEELPAAPTAVAQEAGQEKLDEEPVESGGVVESTDGGAGKGKRQRLDIGKIMALRRAGWPIKEIAGEMQLTNTQVSQAIYNYNKKHAEEVEVS